MQGIVLPDFFPKARETSVNLKPSLGPVFLTNRNKGFLLSLKELVLRMSSPCDFKELTNLSSVQCDEITRIGLLGSLDCTLRFGITTCCKPNIFILMFVRVRFSFRG